MKKLLFYGIIPTIIILSGILTWRFLSKPEPLHLRPSSFSALRGWDEANLAKSLRTFQISCKVILKQDPQKPMGNPYLPLKTKEWQPPCRAAITLSSITNQNARAFFQRWFIPVAFYRNKPVDGLFTSYYMPLLHGSRHPTKKYHTPIYGLPRDLVSIDLRQFDSTLPPKKLIGRIAGHKILPYYTRREITQGAIKGKAPILAYISNPIDRIFLEIQGSGSIKLNDGKMLYLSYAAQNGAPYTSIARVLIDKGVMTKDNASMQAIKKYLTKHPEKINPVLNQNKSFVFFETLEKNIALGTQGVGLTPGYSLAVDIQWVPLGIPVWLNTTIPDDTADDHKPLQRLMIAQDTGGAIKGIVRGDVFWGAGDRATYIAGHMKNSGYYWLLVPKASLK